MVIYKRCNRKETKVPNNIHPCNNNYIEHDCITVQSKQVRKELLQKYRESVQCMEQGNHCTIDTDGDHQETTRAIDSYYLPLYSQRQASSLLATSIANGQRTTTSHTLLSTTLQTNYDNTLATLVDSNHQSTCFSRNQRETSARQWRQRIGLDDCDGYIDDDFVVNPYLLIQTAKDGNSQIVVTAAAPPPTGSFPVAASKDVAATTHAMTMKNDAAIVASSGGLRTTGRFRQNVGGEIFFDTIYETNDHDDEYSTSSETSNEFQESIDLAPVSPNSRSSEYSAPGTTIVPLSSSSYCQSVQQQQQQQQQQQKVDYSEQEVLLYVLQQQLLQQQEETKQSQGILKRPSVSIQHILSNLWKPLGPIRRPYHGRLRETAIIQSAKWRSLGMKTTSVASNNNDENEFVDIPKEPKTPPTQIHATRGHITEQGISYSGNLASISPLSMCFESPDGPPQLTPANESGLLIKDSNECVVHAPMHVNISQETESVNLDCGDDDHNLMEHSTECSDTHDDEDMVLCSPQIESIDKTSKVDTSVLDDNDNDHSNSEEQAFFEMEDTSNFDWNEQDGSSHSEEFYDSNGLNHHYHQERLQESPPIQKATTSSVDNIPLEFKDSTRQSPNLPPPRTLFLGLLQVHWTRDKTFEWASL